MFRLYETRIAWITCVAIAMVTIGCGKSKTPAPVVADASEVAESAKPVAGETPEIRTVPAGTYADVAKEETQTSVSENVIADKTRAAEQDGPTLEKPAPDEPIPGEPESSNPRPKLDTTPTRIFLPTTDGPLLVDLDIRIDSVALETAFSNRMQKVIDDAGLDHSATWNELLDYVASDTALFGPNAARGASQRRDIIQQYDRNRNGSADEDEVAHYLFRSSNFTSPFRLQGSDYYRGRQSQSRLFKAMDRNNSKTLESDEIEIATESLFRIDRSTDQRIDVSEILSPVDPNNNDPAWKKSRISRDGNVPTDLSGYVDWSMASLMLDDMIGKRPFSISADPIAGLDENQDGSISKTEAKLLRNADSDLIIQADLSSSHSDPKLTVLWADPALHDAVQTSKNDATIAFANNRLRLCMQISDRRIGNNQLPPEAFAMFDANNDGFLEESEIPEQFKQQYSFEDLDINDDDKLTLDEIHEGMRPKSPIWSVQVRGRGAEFPDAVFAFLDQNNDLVLSTREILAAGDRLRDQATDGKLKGSDIPNTMMIQLVRGDPMQRNGLFAFTADSATEHVATVPVWAKSMDANGDGDISLIEFPGSRDAFAKLDINGDGLIAFDEVQRQPE